MDLSNSNNMIETLHGGDVYRNEVRLDYSVNLNPLPMPQEVTEAIREGMSEIHQYPDPAQQKLRERIAELEAEVRKYQSVIGKISALSEKINETCGTIEQD